MVLLLIRGPVMLSLQPRVLPMTVSLVPETFSDDLLRHEVPFDASDLNDDGVFDAEPGLCDELDNDQN